MGRITALHRAAGVRLMGTELQPVAAGNDGCAAADCGDAV